MISERGTGRTCKMKAPLRKVQLENIPVHPEMTKEYAPGGIRARRKPVVLSHVARPSHRHPFCHPQRHRGIVQTV